MILKLTSCHDVKCSLSMSAHLGRLENKLGAAESGFVCFLACTFVVVWFIYIDTPRPLSRQLYTHFGILSLRTILWHSQSPAKNGWHTCFGSDVFGMARAVEDPSPTLSISKCSHVFLVPALSITPMQWNHSKSTTLLWQMSTWCPTVTQSCCRIVVSSGINDRIGM